MNAADKSTPLLGRPVEVRLIVDAVHAVVSGHGGSVWVEGEPGIGKSALIDAAFAESGENGCALIRGSGDPLSQSRPLAVLRECRRYRGTSGRSPVEVIADVLGGAQGGEVTASDTVAASAYRFVELVESWSARTPTILFVDDLQWADEASFGVWRILHQLTRQAPLLLLAVSRTMPTYAELGQLHDELLADGATLVALGPLPSDDIRSEERRVG